ncbi:MAG TPA: hypothetical protein VFG15_18855 [Amycolatopsis sp.]|nr:hypothetical protein [Amycolatopsis sp.]
MTVWTEGNVACRQSRRPLAYRLALGLVERTLVGVGINIDERAEAGPWRFDLCGAAHKVAVFVLDNLRA